MRVQGNGNRLSIRAETAAILTQAIDGHRQEIPIDASTLSRYCNGDCANSLEMVLAMIEALPADRAALIAGCISDAFETAHGTPDDMTLEEVWQRLDERDGSEDRERMDVAMSGFGCEQELREWVRSSLEHSRKAEIARRVAVRKLAEMRGRKSTRAASWRGPQTRKAVGNG